MSSPGYNITPLPLTPNPPPRPVVPHSHSSLEALRNQIIMNATYAYGLNRDGKSSRWDVVTAVRTRTIGDTIMTTWKAMLVLMDTRAGEAHVKSSITAETRLQAVEILLKVVEARVDQRFVGADNDPRDTIKVPDVWVHEMA